MYFDHCSYQSGIQRGWIDCALHPACIRYVFVNGTQSRFCAEMYKWHLDRNLPDIQTKGQHLAWKPSDGDVDAVERSLVMLDF